MQRDSLDHGDAVGFGCVVAEVFEQAMGFGEMRLVLGYLPQSETEFHALRVTDIRPMLVEQDEGGVGVPTGQGGTRSVTIDSARLAIRRRAMCYGARDPRFMKQLLVSGPIARRSLLERSLRGFARFAIVCKR